MVKKIRLIEDEEATESSDATDVDSPAGSELIELAKSMDWKLWEILQTLQRFEKKFLVEEKNAKSNK